MINVEIADGRNDLCQWDIDRILKISGANDGAIVYFIDKDTTDPLPVILKNGEVKIPNSLLQQPRLFLKLYVYDNNHTIGFARIRVNAQPKPEGYLINEDDILSWEKLLEMCGVYTPSVSSDGVISWSKSKSTMEDIPSANIKGPQGEQGPQGPKGDTGAQGLQGPKGDDGGIIIRKWVAS